VRREEAFRPRVPALAESQLPVIRAALESLPPERRSVLDVGGGDGRWRPLVGDSFEYTVVDVAEPGDLPPDVKHVVADAAELPFGDASFGGVLMIELLQYVPDPARALAEARRVLATGGVLVLTTRQAWPTHGAANDYFRFTRPGLEHLVRSSGMRPQALVPLGGPASVAVAGVENGLPSLSRPVVKQLVVYPLWRLAGVLDRTVFARGLSGPSWDVSGWLLVARADGVVSA
jgi:SAM-dependent methyltransferase